MEVRWSLLALCMAPLLGCEDNGKPFLPANELCARVAADICAARELCTCEAAAGDCARDELARCQEQSALFEADDDLIYDAERVASVADEQVLALEACEPPFTLGRFYEGTRAEGEECERDTLCESGSCDPDMQICNAPEVVELCPAP